MKHELLCTKHNFEFGFGEPPDGAEVALLPCPLCAKEEIEALTVELTEVTQHRGILLDAIDLKRTVRRQNLLRDCALGCADMGGAED